MEEKLGIEDSRPNALKPAWFWMTVIDTLRYSGMRQNQLLHIRLCDVDLKEGVINLRRKAQKSPRAPGSCYRQAAGATGTPVLCRRR